MELELLMDDWFDQPIHPLASWLRGHSFPAFLPSPLLEAGKQMQARKGTHHQPCQRPSWQEGAPGGLQEGFRPPGLGWTLTTRRSRGATESPFPPPAQARPCPKQTMPPPIEREAICPSNTCTGFNSCAAGERGSIPGPFPSRLVPAIIHKRVYCP